MHVVSRGIPWCLEPHSSRSLRFMWDSNQNWRRLNWILLCNSFFEKIRIIFMEAVQSYFQLAWQRRFDVLYSVLFGIVRSVRFWTRECRIADSAVELNFTSVWTCKGSRNSICTIWSNKTLILWFHTLCTNNSKCSGVATTLSIQKRFLAWFWTQNPILRTQMGR